MCTGGTCEICAFCAKFAQARLKAPAILGGRSLGFFSSEGDRMQREGKELLMCALSSANMLFRGDMKVVKARIRDDISNKCLITGDEGKGRRGVFLTCTPSIDIRLPFGPEKKSGDC